MTHMNSSRLEGKSELTRMKTARDSVEEAARALRLWAPKLNVPWTETAKVHATGGLVALTPTQTRRLYYRENKSISDHVMDRLRMLPSAVAKFNEEQQAIARANMREARNTYGRDGRDDCRGPELDRQQALRDGEGLLEPGHEDRPAADPNVND